jgi:uncharacterized RDD family membrane protein YckC
MHMGAPSPQYATAPAIDTMAGQAVLAGWWRRFGGYVLDALIVDVPVLIVSVGIGLTQRNNFVPGTTLRHFSVPAQLAVVIISVLIALAYPYLLLRHNGQTVGMMAAGVRAVDRTSGVALSSAQAARRVLTFFVVVALWQQIAILIELHHVYGSVPVAESLFRLLSVATLITTALWPLGNPVNQTLQDKAADTVVVRTRT